MGGDTYPDRRDHLMRLMDVDPDWRMHELSDGERRRVQIVMGLLQPFEILLLDEVTVDLDVVVRRNLLDYLKDESRKGATILYATHIFDGLGDWPSHVAHIRNGTVVAVHDFKNFPELEQAKSVPSFDSPLLRVVEKWLRADFEEARARKKQISSIKTDVEKKGENDRVYGDRFFNYWRE